MRIFVSHSSPDQPLVDAFNDLVRGVFVEAVTVASSSAPVDDGGIDAGADWLQWIIEQVGGSDLTLVVLTPLSRLKPWLLWEAGAVTGAWVARGKPSRIVPLLFGLGNDEVPSPLQSRQAKQGFAEAGVRDVLTTIQRAGSLTRRPEAEAGKALKEYLKAVRRIRVPGMHDVFVSCPMASLKGDEYQAMRQTVKDLLGAMRKAGYRAYCAAEKLVDQNAFDPEGVAAEHDLEILRTSRNFVMIYPQKLVSSCLLEAGHALASGKPSMYFVHTDDDLPYMLRGAIERINIVRRTLYKDAADIVAHFKRYPQQVVPEPAGAP